MLLAILLATFAIDKSAMSDKYWEIWNDGVQAKIDADIGKYRGFRGRYRLTWTDVTGKTVEKLIDVK